MTFCFHGFLTRDLNPKLDLIKGDEDEAIAAKRIDDPFNGYVILIPWLANDHVSRMADDPGKSAIISKLADGLFVTGTDWLFLHYETWGGSIDYVEACGRCDGVDIAPTWDDNNETMEATFIEQMGKFGVTPSDASNFPPFHRGFF